MTEAVKLAPEKLLGVPVKPVSRELGADLFGVSAAGRRNEIDLARHSKRLLRERFRGGA